MFIIKDYSMAIKLDEVNKILYSYDIKNDIVDENRPPLHKGTKCDMRFKSSLNSARLNLLNPYK